MKTKISMFGLFILMGITATVFNGCKGKDGAPGAEGPVGQAGTNGTDGANGNANVSSVLLTTNSWNWDGTNYWRYHLWSGISILTNDIANTGSVMLYQKEGSSFVAIPISITTASGSGSGLTVEHDWFQYSAGQLYVLIENEDLSDPISQIPTPTTYKLVCIPSRSMYAHPNIDLKNYNQVKAAFDLKD